MQYVCEVCDKRVFGWKLSVFSKILTKQWDHSVDDKVETLLVRFVQHVDEKINKIWFCTTFKWKKYGSNKL